MNSVSKTFGMAALPFSSPSSTSSSSRVTSRLSQLGLLDQSSKHHLLDCLQRSLPRQRAAIGAPEKLPSDTTTLNVPVVGDCTLWHQSDLP